MLLVSGNRTYGERLPPPRADGAVKKLDCTERRVIPSPFQGLTQEPSGPPRVFSQTLTRAARVAALSGPVNRTVPGADLGFFLLLFAEPVGRHGFGFGVEPDAVLAHHVKVAEEGVLAAGERED